MKKNEGTNAGKSSEYKNKFAYPVNVQIDLFSTASIIEEEGFITYALSVKAKNALNISIQFNEFYLSPNALLSIYTKNELTDSITAKENNPSKVWATRVYQGDFVTIILKVPSSEKGTTSLKIDRVNFGYKKL